MLYFKTLCRHNRPVEETEKLVEKISDLEEKYEFYVELKMWKKAVDVATKLRDPYKLQEVRLSLLLIYKSIMGNISSWLDLDFSF